jgi:hypothetical protein
MNDFFPEESDMAIRLLPLNVGELCAHALELERSCERRFKDYAVRMDEMGERALATCFLRMARALRRELAELESASGDDRPARLSPWEYAWRLTYMPEAVDDHQRIAPASAREALQCAVQARRRAVIFYEDVADNAADAAVRAHAEKLADAKRSQQQRLERMLAREILTGITRRPFQHNYQPMSHRAQ